MIHLNNTSYKKPELVAPAGDIENSKLRLNTAPMLCTLAERVLIYEWGQPI